MPMAHSLDCPEHRMTCHPAASGAWRDFRPRAKANLVVNVEPASAASAILRSSIAPSPHLATQGIGCHAGPKPLWKVILEFYTSFCRRRFDAKPHILAQARKLLRKRDPRLRITQRPSHS